MAKKPMILTSPGMAFDILGDVHGQAEALFTLLRRSGWQIAEHNPEGNLPIHAWHPEGRFVLFTGDLVNKGPDSIRVLRLLMGLTRSGMGLSVMGNHDAMLLEALKHPHRKTKKSVRKTARAIQKRGFIFASRVISLLESLPAQVRIPTFDAHPMAGDGWLTVVHAACPGLHVDKLSASAERRNIFGFSSAEDAKHGKKKRFWAKRYRGARWIIHGHTPVHGLKRAGRTLCLDTGAGDGGNLTLFRLDGGEIMVQPVFLSGVTSTLPEFSRSQSC